MIISRQISLFGDVISGTSVVNIASIPQRSPFRYPGGKTWLVPQVRRWVRSHSSGSLNFLEPFAGGGIISLTVAAEKLAQTITMVELDENVAAVWNVLIYGNLRAFAKLISDFELTPKNLEETLSQTAENLDQLAFQTILRNRTNHGGILAPGAGKIKNGESGKGVFSRWYPNTLVRRILALEYYRQKITFIHGDGMNVLKEYINSKNMLTFIDPPYTAGGKNAGARLYKHFLIDHEQLFTIASQLAGDFLMTYEDNSEVRGLAKKFGFEIQEIQMNNTHHATMVELLISRDLSWFYKEELGDEANEN